MNAKTPGVVAQRTARLALGVVAAIAPRAAPAVVRSVEYRDRDITEVPLHEVLTQRLADALQLTQHLAVRRGQLHVQRTAVVTDHDLDAAHHRRIEADHRTLAAAADLDLEPLSQRLLQRLAPLRRGPVRQLQRRRLARGDVIRGKRERERRLDGRRRDAALAARDGRLTHRRPIECGRLRGRGPLECGGLQGSEPCCVVRGFLSLRHDGTCHLRHRRGQLAQRGGRGIHRSATACACHSEGHPVSADAFHYSGPREHRVAGAEGRDGRFVSARRLCRIRGRSRFGRDSGEGGIGGDVPQQVGEQRCGRSARVDYTRAGLPHVSARRFRGGSNAGGRATARRDRRDGARGSRRRGNGHRRHAPVSRGSALMA